MKIRILTLGIILALVVTMVVPTTVLALDPNQADQSASTFTGAIQIVSKVSDDAVSSIIFPPGAPTGVVNWPLNNVDGPSDLQQLSATASEPVVRLKNSTAGNLIAWLQITDWTNDVVVAEDYELVDTGTVNVNVVDDVLSADGKSATVRTYGTIPAGGYKDLYLEVVLGAVSGVTGSSTLTVLGEAP